MIAGGIYNLGDTSISSAVTGLVITQGVSAQGVAQEFIDRLNGMTAVTLQANFTYGAGDTVTAKVDVETSIDQGATWLPIARFAFAGASAEKVVNLSGLTPKTTATSPAPLSDDACLDGVLGDRLRTKVTSTGTYSGNTGVSVRASVR